MLPWGEIYKGILCVHGGWLYKGAQVMSCDLYKSYVKRGPFNMLRKGGGKGRPALIEWRTIQPKYRKQIIERYGDPEKLTAQNGLTKHLELDTKAQAFFRDYEYDGDKGLTEETIAEYTANVSIYNAVIDYVATRRSYRQKLGKSRTYDIWDEASRLISQLDTKEWPHSLPSSMRRLKPGIKKYKEMGYQALIHANFGNKNSEKVSNDAKAGKITEHYYGFRVYKSNYTPSYNEKITKLKFGQSAANARSASVVFHKRTTVKARGSVKRYASAAQDSPPLRENKLGFRLWFVCVAIQDLGQAALVSGKVPPAKEKDGE